MELPDNLPVECAEVEFGMNVNDATDGLEDHQARVFADLWLEKLNGNVVARIRPVCRGRVVRECASAMAGPTSWGVKGDGEAKCRRRT